MGTEYGAYRYGWTLVWDMGLGYLIRAIGRGHVVALYVKTVGDDIFDLNYVLIKVWIFTKQMCNRTHQLILFDTNKVVFFKEINIFIYVILLKHVFRACVLSTCTGFLGFIMF